MTNRDFINNVNVNESNSFSNLLHHIDPEFEDEINIVEQSRYYSNNSKQFWTKQRVVYK